MKGKILLALTLLLGASTTIWALRSYMRASSGLLFLNCRLPI